MANGSATSLPAPLSSGKGWPFWATRPDLRSAAAPRDEPSFPTISIVTPSYNKVDFIEQTIRSVLLQGYPKLEYYVMDGGSTDGSGEIIARYGDFLSGWVSEPDRGQSDAINKGWSRASGDLLSWLNADDMLAPGALWELADAYSKHPNAGLVHGQMQLIDAEGAPLGLVGAPFDLGESIATTVNPVAQSSAFVSRGALEAVGMVDEGLEMSMDWDLFVRVALKQDTVFVPRVWSYFRKTREAKTRSIKSGFGFDKLVTLEKVFEGDPEAAVRYKSVRRQAFAQAYARCAVGYFRTKEWPEARRTFRRALRLSPRSALARTGPRMALRLVVAGPVLRALARSHR